MSTPVHVLIVEDSDDDAVLVEQELRRAGYDPTYERVETAEQLQAILNAGREFDLVIADYTLPKFNALDALKILRSVDSDIPCIVISGSVDEATVLDAMRAGARDYVLKGNLARLGVAVDRELRDRERRRREQIERRQAEQTRAHLAAIIESSQDAIVSKTLDGVIQSWNKGAERIYGYTAEEAIGRNIAFLVPLDRANEELDILSRIRNGEAVNHFESVRLRKDGQTIDVSLTISPIRDSTGNVIGASHISRDITDRKQLEQQLRHTARLESLGVLAGGIAHDFNNLLVGIMGNASLAIDGLSPTSSARGMLKDVIAASERAAHLTRQLLAYAGKGHFEIQPISLSELVDGISRLIQTSIPKTVQLRLDLYENLPTIEGDIGQIQQLVMNLVINGAEAIEAHGPESTGAVLVTTGVQEIDEAYARHTFAEGEIQPGAFVTLEVHDTGVGMDQATISRIFDPFFTTKFTGRGLGLSAALGIIRGHKGAIKIYSTKGRGSTFKVFFPISEKPAITLTEKGAEQNLFGSGTVLVIDDEELVRKMTKTALELYGYNVVLAENGKEGVDLFGVLKDKIAVVVLDLTMPIMSGEETFRKLRTERPDIKVVLSSGYNEVEAVRRFVGKGLAGFIQKPYTAERLAQKIRSVLNDE
jgi:PAS domain S-box-containing protein